VFPVRYEPDFYISLRRNLVFKGLSGISFIASDSRMNSE
jgi:hypothetical protein